MARQALEVAQHLEAGSAQSARADRLDARLPPLRMAGKVVCLQHHLAEARVTDRVELRLERPGERDRVHAERRDRLLHAATLHHARPSLCTSSNTTLPR